MKSNLIFSLASCAFYVLYLRNYCLDINEVLQEGYEDLHLFFPQEVYSFRFKDDVGYILS